MSNKIKKFKVGDRVRIIASPDTLPDPRDCGTFILPSTTLKRTFIVHYISGINIKLRELDGSNISNDYWYDPLWLDHANPIWLQQQKGN